MVAMDGTMLADRLQDKVAGVCLIAGALLMVPTTYFEYTQGMLFGAGSLGLLLYTLLIPGLLGVARLLRQGAPRLSVIAGLLATLGCVGGTTFQVALLHEWAARTAGTPEAQMTAILNVTEERVFPILVIFGLLAGANIDGLVGALIALPILAVGKAVWEFFAERITFESWSGGGSVPVEVEPVPEPEPERVAGG